MLHLTDRIKWDTEVVWLELKPQNFFVSFLACWFGRLFLLIHISASHYFMTKNWLNLDYFKGMQAYLLKPWRWRLGPSILIIVWWRPPFERVKLFEIKDVTGSRPIPFYIFAALPRNNLLVYCTSHPLLFKGLFHLTWSFTAFKNILCFILSKFLFLVEALVAYFDIMKQTKAGSRYSQTSWW